MQVRVIHTIDELADDLRGIATTGRADLSRAVRRNIETGNLAAKASAKRTSGAHGKHYPNAFSAEMTGPLTGEYGPDAGKPQGGMSFENGSRNQPPHRDLARTAPGAGDRLLRDVDDILDRWFW